ncbi:MAG: minichromosome maintenance protein MCM [Candidatus Aenigmarchaeota archaeon]|nr:minichromosome maintenance protein MCM [Candidatus Aenigmarchaeota archaeon]
MEKGDIQEKFSQFLREFYYNELVTAVSEGRKSINVDFSVLEKFDSELADYTLENPEEIFQIAEESLKQVDLPSDLKLRVRFFNLPELREIRIRNLRAEHIGKLIVVDGMVRRASEVRPEVSEAIFQCPQCGEKMTIIQTGTMINPPFQCDRCDNTKNFKLVEQKIFDARWLAIEEPFEITTGERPSEIKVFLKEDLTTPKMRNKTDPGNRIKVTGVLKQLPRRIKGTLSRQMEIFVDANYLHTVEVEWEELDISNTDEKRILELSKDPQIYDKLIASIVPSIYGHEDIKEAIVLQLFGGVPHVQKDKSRVRGDIHILLVGDPSTAKSVLMKTVSGLIPRGRYVSGKGVTAAGLTATVVRDEEFLGGWVLEAGALVMCNRSLLAIDEFEKVDKSDQVALHEGMEQQSISIAKANIVATLPARTSVLAGGNPKLGRFDPYVPIKEQIEVPETLLSRFDLKFALRDIPNPQVDELVAEHILKTRHFDEDTVLAPIEDDFLKKYVAYARKNAHPKLTREAGNELKSFFVGLREKVTHEEAPVPITLRQYEALIRMAEASAKIQLKDTVTREDAIRAINLMKSSLRDFGFDVETGKIDIDRVEGRTSSSERGKIRTMLDIIEELISTVGKNVPKEEILKTAKAQGIKEFDIEKMLSELKRNGTLFEPSPGIYQKM